MTVDVYFFFSLTATESSQAEDAIRNDPNVNHEYLPIAGLPELAPAAQKLIFGADSPVIAEKRVSLFFVMLFVFLPCCDPRIRAEASWSLPTPSPSSSGER